MKRDLTMPNHFYQSLLLPPLLLLAVLLPAPAAALPAATDSVPPAVRAAAAAPGDRSQRFNEYFLEAIRQKEKGAYDAEYELLRAALRLHPDAPEALYEMGLLRLSFAGTADTLARAEGDSLLRRAVELDPENLQCKELLANHLAREGNYAEAIALYEEMTAKAPTTERLTVLVGLQEESADFKGAVRTLDRLEQLEGKTEAYSLEKFKIYTMMNDNEKAYAAIEDLCAEYPTDLRYRVLLGDLYQQNGYHEMALAIYRDVLTLEPDNSYAQISLLAYYKAEGEDSLYDATVEDVVLNPRAQMEAKVEAMRGYIADNMANGGDSMRVLSLFRRALSLPQEDRSLAELCAYYMVSVKLPSDSLAPVMRRILEIEPDYLRARLQLLNILLRKEDIAGVVQLCRESVLYDPSQLVFYYYEGMAQLQLEHSDEAIAALLRGTQHIDENTDYEMASDLYAALGDTYHEAGRTAEAYAAYDKALTYNADNLLCLNNYAYFLSLEGAQLDKAEAMSRRTIEAEPDNATYLDTYAWILYRLKRYEQARTYIDETLKNADETAGNASLFHHAGDIYYRCGQRDEAVAFWTKAAKLTDDAAERAELTRKIKRRRL